MGTDAEEETVNAPTAIVDRGVIDSLLEPEETEVETKEELPSVEEAT